MEMLGKIVRGLASIPIIGGALVFVLGFLPVLLVIPLNLSNGLSMIIGGLLMAAWCYFLSTKKIINIVTPLIPIPLWILGIVMALAGVYGIVTNKWDDPTTAPETTVQSKPEVSQPVEPMPSTPEVSTVETPKPTTQQDPATVEKDLEAREANLEKLRGEAAETALVQMQESLESMKQLKETVGAEKLQEIMNAHGDGENPVNFEDAMAEMQKQIDELKRQGYGIK